jgi:2-C-methyl-D-erythritol 4-phosphate cytidylyltransferase
LGLDAVPAEVKVVIVHDMVRPFVDVETLARVALAAKEHKAGTE